jgi:sugar lactone lactonase YvrE
MFRTIGAAAGLALAAGAAQAATVNEITIDGSMMFPESIHVSKAGDVYIGGSANGAVYRARKGSAKAELWLDPAKTGFKSALGVFADDASNTFYLCTVSPRGGAPMPEQSNLHAFNLKTGAPIKSYPLPGGAAATCNDVDIDKQGNVFVAETSGGRVLKLKKGGAALESWIADERLRGVDGLAFIDDGQLIVNTVTTSRMFRIPVNKDGSAGAAVELTPSMPLASPDGMRKSGGKRVLQAESRAARVTEITVDGDKAVVRVVKDNAPSTTSMALDGKRVWVLNSKFNYRTDAALKDKSPDPFTVPAVPLGR